MKWLYVLSLGFLLTLIIEAYAVEHRRFEVPSENIMAPIVHESNDESSLWHGYASPHSFSALQDGTFIQTGKINSEDLGGSWPGPRW